MSVTNTVENPKKLEKTHTCIENFTTLKMAIAKIKEVGTTPQKILDLAMIA